MTAPADDAQGLQRRNRRLMLGLLGVVVMMVGMSFAAVPLYDLFCRVTGFGGTTQVAGGTTGEVLDRTVRVRFVGQVGDGLPWRFSPETREVEARIGEPMLVYYTAENTSAVPVAGTAVYNVTPLKSGLYFTKIQCFCFGEQVLAPGESTVFPVYFFLDPSMADDVNQDDVTTVTLSYTFFPTDSQGLDQAIAAYYRSVEEAAAPAATN